MADGIDRYFPDTQKAAGAAPKKRGRKPKVRHDVADDLPLDGDYKPLELVNTDPAFEYSWLSEADRASVASGRGYEPVTWSEGCARPRFYFGLQTPGAEVRQRELVLHRVPKSRMARIRELESRNHREMAKALMKRAVESGPHGKAKVHTTEVSV